MKYLTKCDKDGVPWIVQHMRAFREFDRERYVFQCELFNGDTERFFISDIEAPIPWKMYAQSLAYDMDYFLLLIEDQLRKDFKAEKIHFDETTVLTRLESAAEVVGNWP